MNVIGRILALSFSFLVFIAVLIAAYLIFAVPTPRAPQSCQDDWENLRAQLRDVTCDGFALNDACYGSDLLRVEYHPEVTPTQRFAMRGDVSQVQVFSAISTSPLDRANGHYGVGLLRLQAAVTNTMRGNPVTFVLYGDSELDEAPADAEIAGGRTRTLSPFSAFYLSTGIGLTGQCLDLPEGDLPSGGLLIDTQGTRIRFSVNGVRITLGSIAILQSTTAQLSITVLEGRAQVEAPGQPGSSSAGALQTIRVPLANNAPSGSPSAPVFESQTTLQQNYGLNTICLLASWALMRPIPACTTATPLPTSTLPPSPSRTPRPPTRTPAPPRAQVCRVTISVNVANVRSGPGVEYGVVEQVRSGERLTASGIAFSTTGELWYRLDGTRERWISAVVVSISGACDALPGAPVPPPLPTLTPTFTVPPPIITTPVPPPTLTPTFTLPPPIIVTTPAPLPVIANFTFGDATLSYDPNGTCYYNSFDSNGAQVAFFDSSSGPVVGYAWSFGSVSTSTAPNPSIYLPGGSHTIVLTVFRADGANSQTSQTILVCPPPP